jgi:hypothetical protein
MKRYLFTVFVIVFLIGLCSAQVPVTMQCNCTCVTTPGNVTTTTGSIPTTTVIGPTTTTIPFSDVLITSLSPGCVSPTTPGMTTIVSVKVNGYNFAQNSVIYINDGSVGTVFNSETQLVALIPSSYLINAGEKYIFVRTRNRPQSNTVTLLVSLNCSATTTQVPSTIITSTTTTVGVTTTTVQEFGELILSGFNPSFILFNGGEQKVVVSGDNFPINRNFQVWLYFGVNSSVSNGDDLHVTVISKTEGVVTIPASYTTWEALNGAPQDPNTGDYLIGTFMYFNLDPISRRSDGKFYRIKNNN